MQNSTTELLELHQRLLDSIASRDWKTYEQLCDPGLTSFEPEACGQLVTGLDFHHFHFRLGPVTELHHTQMASPHVRIMGDVAIVSYVRINLQTRKEGALNNSAYEETRGSTCISTGPNLRRDGHGQGCQSPQCDT